MADREQVRKLKCPHCGWVRSVPVGIVEDESTASVVRGGLSDAIKDAVAKIRAALADAQLDEANAWVDMPKCPHCGNPYRYNVRTGEIRK